MADLLSTIRAEIDARLRELKPVIAEFEQLGIAAQALAVEGAGTPAPAKRGRPAKATKPARSVKPVKPAKVAKAAKPRKTAAHTPTGEAILAALEHGSHTVAELVLVSALPAGEIRESLRQLRKRKAVVKTDRDGRSAYALPMPAA
jgi:DNA-binding transcriptional ArsR family regulator